jgi:hypothetical protein
VRIVCTSDNLPQLDILGISLWAILAGVFSSAHASVSYRLLCAGGQEATGTAQWLLRVDRSTGRLDVRLGGKNMTFSQRVTATRLGDCVPDAK